MLYDLAVEAVKRFHADQKPRELAELGCLLRAHFWDRRVLQRPCRRAIEIGTYRGGSARFWWGIGFGYIQTIDRDQSRADRIRYVEYIEGDSRTVDAWSECDFLFIDGDHSYEGVWADWARFSPRVRPGGLVAFHDIVGHRPETGCQVSQVWAELKRDHTTIEIVDPYSENGEPWGGIGVVCV